MSIDGTKLTLNDLTILGLLLECKTGVTGLELEKTIDNRNMRVWTKIGKSSIYFGLKKLENNKFVSSESKQYRKNQSTPPIKEKFFKITQEGKNEMEEAVFNILSTHKKIIDPFDLALSFSFWLSPERKKEALKLRLKMINDRKEFLQTKFEEFKKPGAHGLDIEGQKDYNPLVLKNILILFSKPLSVVNAEENWIINNIDEIIQ